MQSFNVYLNWERFNAAVIPDDAVEICNSANSQTESKVLIGRVERDGHVIPGSIRGGICRFRFNGEWQTESERIEVLRDEKFGMANKVLIWKSPKEMKDKQQVVHLPLWAEIGGIRPTESSASKNDEPSGFYLIGRLKGTCDVIPLAINADDRHFDEQYIEYKGDERDFEVLDCEYPTHLAICPSAPEGDAAE